MSAPFDDERAAQLCIELVKLSRDSGDAVHLVKLLSVACAVGIDGVQRPGESVQAAAGSLIMTTLAIVAVELDIDVESLLRNIQLAIDDVSKRMANLAAGRSTLVNAPGGVA